MCFALFHSNAGYLQNQATKRNTEINILSKVNREIIDSFSLPISGFQCQCLLLQLCLEGVRLGTLKGVVGRERLLSDRSNDAGMGQRLQDGLLREPDTELALEGSYDELGLALATRHQHGLDLAHLVIHTGMPCDN